MQEEKSWSETALESLAKDILKEQRSRRRWSVFIKLLVMVWLFLVLYFMVSGPSSPEALSSGMGKHTAVIRIYGEISEGDDPNSSNNILKDVRKAFKDTGTQGIILDINSPGGSAVQSDLIFREIMYQRKQHPKIKIYAVCQDVCASGAYYVAASTNEIYANPASLVGSIGALINGFGFVDTMQRLGVERRLFKAGAEKDFLDPFSPMSPIAKEHAQEILTEVHQHFINSVKEGRGDRLKGDPTVLFSGLVWTGDDAKRLGLIDGFASVEFVARNIIKERHIKDYSETPSIFHQFTKNLGMTFGQAVGTAFTNSLLQTKSRVE